jgi:hypothetical protein
MDYRLSCACGQQVTVNESAAGTTVTCPCGRAIDVPSWRELSIRSGRRAPALSPELVIETLLAAGKVPFEPICARCGAETDRQVQVMAECERVQVKGGGLSWLTLTLSALFLPVLIFYRKSQVAHGRDKVYWLPLPVCQPCQGQLPDEASLRRALQKVEVYARLLKKFPKARIRLATLGAGR